MCLVFTDVLLRQGSSLQELNQMKRVLQSSNFYKFQRLTGFIGKQSIDIHSEYVLWYDLLPRKVAKSKIYPSSLQNIMLP